MEREKLIAVVKAAQKGDQPALNLLFNTYYNDVYYFALKTVKDVDLACDITQETFAEIINTIGQLQEPAAFVKWMKQITYHQCTRYFKKKKDVLVDEDEEGNTVFDTLAEERTEFIPDEALDQQDFRNTILAMLDELSEEQRAATLLYYYDELSVKQIAEIQGVSEGTVKSRLNYARKSIKTSVETYEKKNGVKLHCAGVLPLLLWVLTTEKKNTAAIAAKIFGASTGVAPRAATTIGAASGTGLAAKIIGLPLAVKVISCAVTGVMLIGAIISSNSSPKSSGGITWLPQLGTEQPVTTGPSEMALEAYAAYEQLLSCGTTENGMKINYYAYLDLGKDGVPELLVSNDDGTPNSWSNGEVYTYRDSQIQFCGSTNTRYDYFYYVNEQYLLGCHRMGNQYISTDGYMGYPSAEFEYYNTMPTENGSSETFIITAEPIKLLKNTFQRVTDANILAKFFEAKDFYEAYIYGRRFFDADVYSADDFDWIEGIVEYNGCLYEPCGTYSYYNFIKDLNYYFTPEVVDALIKEAGIIDYEYGSYAYIREGVGDPHLGDYQAIAEMIDDNLYELQISFTSLEGMTTKTTIYCRKVDETWVFDGSNFFGE